MKIEAKVDIDIEWARQMLDVFGDIHANEYSEDVVIEKVFKRIACYGVKLKEVHNIEETRKVS